LAAFRAARLSAFVRVFARFFVGVGTSAATGWGGGAGASAGGAGGGIGAGGRPTACERATFRSKRTVARTESEPARVNSRTCSRRSRRTSTVIGVRSGRARPSRVTLAPPGSDVRVKGAGFGQTARTSSGTTL
jgi:hypothetical protein